MSFNPDAALTENRRSTNGITLHCMEAGPENGRPVVLLHGFPEFWWGWRKQIAPLAASGYRVIVPDQRGYNLSDKPQGREAYGLDALAADVVGLADAYGYETVSLVGHDWGGLAAWWTAACHPDRIERLIAINAPHPSALGPYLRTHPRQMLRSLYVGFFRIPRLPEAMLGARSFHALKRELVRTSRSGTFSDADLARYEEAWSRPGALTAMLNWYRAIPFPGARPIKPRLVMPVCILWGTQDRFLETGLAEASLGLCDRGRILRFEGASHWVHLEEPERVNAALDGFLKA